MGPAKTPGPPQPTGSGAGALRDGGADMALVLSPGVTLTLGRDALLVSGMSSSRVVAGDSRKRKDPFFSPLFSSPLLSLLTLPVCVPGHCRPARTEAQPYMSVYWRLR